jgi:hypothetical protein
MVRSWSGYVRGDDGMTDLRRYPARDILAAAEDLAHRLDKGALSRVEFTVAANDFRFRDETGVYWFLDVRTKDWYRFAEGSWQPPSPNPEILEGPTFLTFYIPTTTHDTSGDFEPLLQEQDPGEWTPTRAIEVMVEGTRLAYERGPMSSEQVEEFLTGQYIADQKGRFWTVGVRSGLWYYSDVQKWTMSEQPPGLDSLLRLAEQPQPCAACGNLVDQGQVCPKCGAAVVAELSPESAQAFGAMLGFLYSRPDPIPEQVTDPWNPPLGFPEPLTEPDVRCDSCGARNPAGGLFCNQCGTGLGCPSCGAANPPDHRFCCQCGAALGA